MKHALRSAAFKAYQKIVIMAARVKENRALRSRNAQNSYISMDNAMAQARRGELIDHKV